MTSTDRHLARALRQVDRQSPTESSSGVHTARLDPSSCLPWGCSGLSFSGAVARGRGEVVVIDPTSIGRNLHSEEIKVRLRPGDKELIDALALRLDIPVAVLVRRLVLHSLESRDVSVSLREQAPDGRVH